MDITRQQLDLITRAQHLLLSSHSDPSSASWRSSLLDIMQPLFRTDAGVAIFVNGDTAKCSSVGSILEGEIQQFIQHLTGSDPAKLAGAENAPVVINVRRNKNRPPGAGNGLGQNLHAASWLPADVEHAIGMASEAGHSDFRQGIRTEAGLAAFVVLFRRESRGEQDDIHDEMIMRLLQPALQASLEAHCRRRGQYWQLLGVIDSLEIPLLIYGRGGRLLHHNQELARLLESDPAREMLQAEIGALAREILPKTEPGSTGDISAPQLPLYRSTRTSTSRYRIMAISLIENQLPEEQAVLFALLPHSRPHPRVDQLCTRYDLTLREAQIAQQLLEGKSNQELASALFISPHTVRHHVEHLFEKLDVHSRSEAVAKLLS